MYFCMQKFQITYWKCLSKLLQHARSYISLLMVNSVCEWARTKGKTRSSTAILNLHVPTSTCILKPSLNHAQNITPLKRRTNRSPDLGNILASRLALACSCLSMPSQMISFWKSSSWLCCYFHLYFRSRERGVRMHIVVRLWIWAFKSFNVWGKHPAARLCCTQSKLNNPE